MAEQIEQYMRTLKLSGLAKDWRSVRYENTEQYVTDLLKLELHEREVNRINRMVKTAGFRVMKTLDDFIWNSNIELPAGLTQAHMESLQFLAPKENLIFMGTVFTPNYVPRCPDVPFHRFPVGLVLPRYLRIQPLCHQ